MRKLATLSLATSLLITTALVLSLHTATKAPEVIITNGETQMDQTDFLNQYGTALTGAGQEAQNFAPTFDALAGNVTVNTGPAGTSYYDPGGAGYTAPASTYNPQQAATLAQYDQAIGNTQAGINRLPTQLSSGNSSIDTSYQNALNSLLQGKNTGERNYNQAKQTTATGYVGAKNTIGSQAGSTLSGLLRLLGSRGAGGSSAALTVAPQAVTRGASLQRADVANTFGQNNQALDTNWNDYLQGYNNQVTSAGSQRDQARQGLQSSIDTNRASLLQSLAQLQAQRDQAAGGTGVAVAQPYLDQANALLDKTANYTTAPINYQTQAYQAPTAASYTVNPNATPQYSGAGPNDYFSPYLQQLLGKKQQIA